ncbi:MAG: hypothetical protein Q8K72_13225, partial [Acidimicrobiales bacterium]|nr:hypothetical protein [Acidimicrobiales bacterium]
MKQALLAQSAGRDDQADRLLDRATAELDALSHLAAQPVDGRPSEATLYASCLSAFRDQLRGQFDTGERALRPLLAALTDGQATLPSQMAVAARRRWADLLAARGRWADAGEQFRLAGELVDQARREHRPVSLRPAHVTWDTTPRIQYAVALAKSGRAVAAFEALEQGLARSLIEVRAGRGEPGHSASPAEIQGCLTDEEALVGWAEVTPAGPGAAGLRYAYVLRKHGDPVWVELPSSGRSDSPSPDPIRELSAHLARRGGGFLADPKYAEWREAVYKGWFAPLRPHLGPSDRLPAVRQLIVVSAGPLVGVPVETLTDEYGVRYTPSGGTLRRGGSRPRPEWPTAPTLVAFGAPKYGTPP